ncbi:hypothetical protein [Paracoccus seriniphilus]|uniref:hypothetical protein n=1 Tax=Paracoccus seriniphilus TaxID=184748 RepID=UPI00234FCCFD|nr:hypothetical protein [Paracoccus seriniphilus]WCR16114.1 hypothetical protein JHW44_16840 [Paracoccus seriniphilus]
MQSGLRSIRRLASDPPVAPLRREMPDMPENISDTFQVLVDWHERLRQRHRQPI